MRNVFRLLTLAMLSIGTVSAQGVPFEAQFRRALVQAQEEAAAAAAEYQRIDRITTVLVGTASPVSNSGAQTSTAIFGNADAL